jgi:hypothetical protein
VGNSKNNYHPEENTVTRGVTHKPMCLLILLPQTNTLNYNDLKISAKSNCNKIEPRVTITQLSLHCNLMCT